MQINYLPLDVVLDHTEEGYVVRLADSSTGNVIGDATSTAAAPFQPPFTTTELAHFHRLVATGETNSGQSDEAELTLQQWGERLFKALFPGTLASFVQNAYRLAYQERARLRIRIQIDHEPDLSMLPWEYLFDPIRREFMALSLQSPFIRYTNLMHQIVPFKVEPPLRMLVVISSPGGYPPFDREKRWFTILDQLDYLAREGKLMLERLNKPTLFDLQRRLREKEYHLLHFIGHGATNEFTSEGSLIFEDEMGRARPVNGEHLGALLRDHYSLRLVTLSACDVVRTPNPNPYLSIAATLVRRGLPAVVATHSQVPEVAMPIFVDKFYGMVANFIPVDLAMNETRRALFAEQQGNTWGLPALFTRLDNGQLFIPNQSERQPTDGVQEKTTRGRLWAGFGKR